MQQLHALSLFVVLLLLPVYAHAAAPVYTDPAEADEDFAFQGEYVYKSDERSIGAQVVALGDGKFDIVVYSGGLPGEGWDEKSKLLGVGHRQDESVVTKFDDRMNSSEKLDRTIIKDGRWEITETVVLKKIHRKSPTLEAKPPKGAVVLFDGTTAEHFKDGKLTDDGLLQHGCTSKQEFGSQKLHLEFILPYQPHDRGQGRGNSGVYLQGRYEVQMLDSFGLKGESNECGGIYSVAAPRINMCYPPLTWQTYDIDYTAAKYDDAGKLQSNPRMTVHHNGVLIHDNVEIPADNTTAAPVQAGPSRGPVYLQDHGNPVRYRNIWVVETE